MALEALHVNLTARLGEREVVRTEADDGIRAIHGLDERFQRALEVSHRHALVNDKPLDLVEHRRVRCIDLVLAVHAARGKHTDGRLADGLHGADLHGAGLRAEEDLFIVCDVERVAAVTGRVIFRDVQLREVILGKLDLGAVEDLKAHRDEQILRLVERNVHRVAVAKLHGLAGDGDVDGLGLELLLERLCLEGGLCLIELLLDGGADVVCDLTHDGALLGGELAHRLEDGGQLALFAEKADAQGFQLAGIGDGVQRLERLLPDLFKLLFHKMKFSFC